MFKLIWGAIKLGFLVIILGLVFHQAASRFLLSSFLRFQLGVPVEVGKASVDFVNAEVRFEDVEIWNPKDYPSGVMIYIREMTLDSELSKLFSSQPVFDKIEIEADNVRLIKLIDEPLNILATHIYQKPRKIPFMPEARVEEFVLSVGQASFHDEASAGSGDLSLEVGLRRMTYYKVKSLRNIVDILSWEVLKKMRLESLGSGYLEQIRDDLEGAKSYPSTPRSAAWR